MIPMIPHLDVTNALDLCDTVLSSRQSAHERALRGAKVGLLIMRTRTRRTRRAAIGTWEQIWKPFS
jgi:hypothetical protein